MSDTYVTHYFLGLKGLGEFECDKAKWVEAERSVGFRPKWGACDTEPCTGGFSSGLIVGRIVHQVVQEVKG